MEGLSQKIIPLAQRRCPIIGETEPVSLRGLSSPQAGIVRSAGPVLGGSLSRPGYPKAYQPVETASQRTLHLFGVLGSSSRHAEQQIRNPVLTRKEVSQQKPSKDGAKTQAILMSLFRSAQLQGLNPIETVKTVRTITKIALGTRSPEEILNRQLILFSKS